VYEYLLYEYSLLLSTVHEKPFQILTVAGSALVSCQTVPIAVTVGSVAAEINVSPVIS
jgi:hypothetical protein